MSADNAVQTWILDADHAIATWLEPHAMIPYAARCKCGWHVASASAGLRNWNVEGHAGGVRRTNNAGARSCAVMSDNATRYWYVVYNSDGNAVEATGRPERLGAIIARHYALVDRTPGAAEPFLTVKREETTP